MSRRVLLSACALAIIRDWFRACADGYAAARTYEVLRPLAEAELHRRGLAVAVPVAVERGKPDTQMCTNLRQRWVLVAR